MWKNELNWIELRALLSRSLSNRVSPLIKFLVNNIVNLCNVELISVSPSVLENNTFFSKITSKINKKEGNNWTVTPLILQSVSFHWSLRNERRNSIPMTRHYPELGSASDWLNQISHAARPIRRTTQIWVVTDTSSAWNICTRFSDVIWQGNQ